MEIAIVIIEKLDVFTGHLKQKVTIPQLEANLMSTYLEAFLHTCQANSKSSKKNLNV